MTSLLPLLSEPPPFDPFSGQMNAQATAFVLNWRDNVPKINAIYQAINDALGSAMLGFVSSSTTNLTIALGNQSLTIEANKGFVAGQNIKLTSASDVNKFILAKVVSYNKNTGAIVVNSNAVSGSGSCADWQVSINVPDFEFAKMQVEVRTSNQVLGKTDSGKLIKCAASFIQTFDSAAALGSGWFCYLRNEGGVEVTIPNSDGVSNWKMYDNELRLFYVEGAQLKSLIINPFKNKVFVSDGVFLKPPGYSKFQGAAWGGGAGGVIYWPSVAYGSYFSGAINVASFPNYYGTVSSFPSTRADMLVGAAGGDSLRIDVMADVLPFANPVVVGAGGVGHKYQLDASNTPNNALPTSGGVSSVFGLSTNQVLPRFLFNNNNYGNLPMFMGVALECGANLVDASGINQTCSAEYGRASRPLCYKTAGNSIAAHVDEVRLRSVECWYGGQMGQTVGVFSYADTNADNLVDGATFQFFSSPVTRFGGAAGSSIVHSVSQAVTAQNGAPRGGAGGSIVLNKGLNFVGVLTNFNGAIKAGDGGRGEVVLSGVI